MIVGTGDAALMAGLMTVALGLVRVIELLVKSRNGKRKSDPSILSHPAPAPVVDQCVDCRDLVRETSLAIRDMSKSGEREIKLLEEIRDSVRDLRRDADRAVTGQFRVPPQQ